MKKISRFARNDMFPFRKKIASLNILSDRGIHEIQPSQTA